MLTIKWRVIDAINNYTKTVSNESKPIDFFFHVVVDRPNQVGHDFVFLYSDNKLGFCKVTLEQRSPSSDSLQEL